MLRRLAKKYGFQVRYYMMVGNRGETIETFQQSLDFIKQAQPHEVAMSYFAIYPGTKEFNIFLDNDEDPEFFFKQDFIELYDLEERIKDWEQIMNLKKDNVCRNFTNYTSGEIEIILERLPNNSSIHMDLAGAYFREREYDKAEKHVRTALEMNYPLPGIAFNYLACIAANKQDYSSIMAHLFKAYKFYPHHDVIYNLNLFADWHREGGPYNGHALNLIADSFMDTTIILQQPETPGPIKLSVDEDKKIINLGHYSNCRYIEGEPLNIQIQK